MTIKATNSERRPRGKDAKPRHFPGKAEAALLLRLLNDGSAAERAALLEIVLILKALEEVTPITRQGFMGEAQCNQRERTDILNRILMKYKARPTIEIRGPKLKLRWRRTGVRSPGRRQAIVIEELDAVLIALQLAEDGLLHKIRQCGVCGEWFFGKDKKAKWCNGSCKTAHYRSELAKKDHAEAERKNLPNRIVERKRVRKIGPRS